MKKLWLCVLVFSSCAPVYVPNIRNSPMFDKKGEFQGAVQVGNGLDAQAAVAISSNLGLIGNYSYINRDRLNENDFHRHTFYEGGLGYFNNVKDTYFEFFAGYGKGEGSSSNSFINQPGAGGRYERYFIQPAIGQNNEVFDFSFVPRVSIVNFTEFFYGTTTTPIDEDPKVFFEPAFVGRVNMQNNHMFFTFQVGTSVRVSNDVYFDHRNLQLSSGLGFRIGGKHDDKKSLKDVTVPGN